MKNKLYPKRLNLTYVSQTEKQKIACIKYSHIKCHGNNLIKTLNHKQYVCHFPRKFLNPAFAIYYSNFPQNNAKQILMAQYNFVKQDSQQLRNSLRMCVKDVIIGRICKLKLMFLISFSCFTSWSFYKTVSFRYMEVNFWENIYIFKYFTGLC